MNYKTLAYVQAVPKEGLSRTEEEYMLDKAVYSLALELIKSDCIKCDCEYAIYRQSYLHSFTVRVLE